MPPEVEKISGVNDPRNNNYGFRLRTPEIDYVRLLTTARFSLQNGREYMGTP